MEYLPKGLARACEMSTDGAVGDVQELGDRAGIEVLPVREIDHRALAFAQLADRGEHLWLRGRWAIVDVSKGRGALVAPTPPTLPLCHPNLIQDRLIRYARRFSIVGQRGVWNAATTPAVTASAAESGPTNIVAKRVNS
jgi:hypothetical protein